MSKKKCSVKQWWKKEWELHPLLAKVLIGVGVGVILLGIVIVAYTAAYWNMVLPGVRVAGWEVGNRNGEEVANLIEERISSSNPEVEIAYGEEKKIVSWEKIEGEVDVANTVNKAWTVGREGSWLERAGKAQRSFFEGVDLSLKIKVNEESLDKIIEEIEAVINEEQIKPSLIIENEKLILEKGKQGRKLEREKLEELILAAFGNWENKEIEAPVKTLGERLNEEKAKEALSKAEQLLGKEMVLEYDGKDWILGEEDLLTWVKINEGGGFDRQAVSETVGSLAEGINRESENAAFKFEDGQVKEFRAAKEGWTVREKELVDKIMEAWNEILSKDKLNIKVPISKTKPEITTGEVNNLGIEELIGRGDSTYYHSIPNRVHNVGLAARRISGALIEPGEVFSFNEHLGDVSQATGYKSAYVISNGRTELGDGGGVCQVSTTMFRAALDAGLPIVERHAHSYRVSYYEQDSPAGIDATVFAPRVDLKFKNNTPSHILIQAVVDESNRYLAFEIYGTDDGRSVEISKPKVWGQTPPPPPLYEDDPTLPEGQVKQIDWAAWGAKASFDYEVVSADGEVLIDDSFYSNYQPWQAIYLRGTKKE